MAFSSKLIVYASLFRLPGSKRRHLTPKSEFVLNVFLGWKLEAIKHLLQNYY